MRPIKFRGKRIDTGEWVYGGYAEFFDHSFIAEVDSESQCHGARAYILREVEVDPKTVGQFIGATDKNGVEVYEKDVVESAPFGRRVVEYENELPDKWGGQKIGYFNYTFEDRPSYPDDDFDVVIGNVIDSPNLPYEEDEVEFFGEGK